MKKMNPLRKLNLTRIPFDIRLVYFNNLQNQPQLNKETQLYTESHLYVERIDYHRIPIDDTPVGSYVRIELSATVIIDGKSWCLKWNTDGKCLDGNHQHDLLMFIWTV